MSLYSSYSDEDLQAEIADLKSRIINAGKSAVAGVRSVAGEGRRIELAAGSVHGAGSVPALENLLAKAEAEWNKRQGHGGSAIGVVF